MFASALLILAASAGPSLGSFMLRQRPAMPSTMITTHLVCMAAHGGVSAAVFISAVW